MYTYKQEILNQKFELEKQREIQEQAKEIEKLSYVLQESMEKDEDSNKDISLDLL